ncbi:MAG: AAA family ATPase [Elusimicrobiota bacterium]
MIIGLTGSFCSGKDTVAEYLQKEKNFIHHSLSDVIRDDIRRRGKAVTRDNLVKTGIALRTKYGYAVLAERVLRKLKKGKNFVVTSIRHSDEVKALRKNGDFRFIFVDAPAKIRFMRMLARKRENDPGTYKEFLALERKESQTKGAGQQLGLCKKMADLKLNNSTSNLRKLHATVDKLINRLKDH